MAAIAFNNESATLTQGRLSRGFQSGQSGNPAGRRPGTRNRVTIEAQVAAAQIVDDPDYRAALRQRMINGTAGAMEPLMWFYAKGKPVERVEHGQPGAFADLTDIELKAKLEGALDKLGRRADHRYAYCHFELHRGSPSATGPDPE